MTTELFSGAVPLLIFVAKATLLLVAAVVATISLRRSTAGARHLVWLAALVGVLALPLLSRIPALQLGILPAIGTVDAVLPQPAIAPSLPSSALAPQAIAPEAPSAGVGISHSDTPVAAPAIAPVIARVPTMLEFTISSSLLTTLAIVWAAIALSLVAWLIVGAIQVRGIVANATELATPDWTTPLCEVADRLDLEMPPRLVMSDRIEMAFACRALAPTIVVPEAAAQWTDERRRAVLFHELAHIKRHDLLGHTLGRLACALYWFHPLVWTAAKNLRNESERACDDLVLSCGALPSEYAQHLLDMVTSVRHHGAPIMALPMARKKEFEGRMLAILDPAICRASPGRLQSAVVVASLSALSLTVAAVSPATAHARDAVAPESVSAQAATPRAAHGANVRVDVGASAPNAKHSLDVADSIEVSNAIGDGVANAHVHVDAIAPHLAGQGGVSAEARAEVRTDKRTEMQLRTTTTTDTVTRALENIITSATALGLHEAGKAVRDLANGRVRPAQADNGRIAMLIKVMSTDTDASVRRSAAWALEEIQTPGAKASLVAALKSDADARVREMSAWSLADRNSDDVAAALADALVHDKSDMVRRTSAWALGQGDRRMQTDALITAISDANVGVREAAIWALGQSDLHRAPPTVVSALSDNDARVRTVAAWTLGEIGDATVANAIVKAFETETDRSVRMAQLHALTEFDAAPASVIDIAMKSSDPELRRRGVEMLAGHNSAWPWPWPWPQPRPNP